MQVGSLTFDKKHLKFGLDCLAIGILLFFAAAVLNFTISYLRKTQVYSINNGIFEHADFINCYIMSKMVLSADRFHLYDSQVQLHWYNDAISPAHINVSPYCGYFPYVFLLMSPLAALPLKSAFLCWNMFSIAITAVSLWLIRQVRQIGQIGQIGQSNQSNLSDQSRIDPVLGKLDWIVLLIGMLASFPSLDSVRGGEMSWIMLTLLALFYWSFARRYDVVCGITLGLMIFKPHYMIFALIPPLVGFRKKLILAMVAAALVLVVCSGFACGWESIVNYPSLIVHNNVSNAVGTVFPERFVSIRGPAHILLPGGLEWAVAIVSYILGVVFTGYLWWLSLRSKTVLPSWSMALTVLALLICSPHVHVYDCVFLALPAFLTLPSAFPTKVCELPSLPFRAYSLIFLSYPVASWVIMSLVPRIGQAILPEPVQTMFAVNNLKCGLLSFSVLLLVNIALLVLGTMHVLKGSSKEA